MYNIWTRTKCLLFKVQHWICSNLRILLYCPKISTCITIAKQYLLHWLFRIKRSGDPEIRLPHFKRFPCVTILSYLTYP